MRVLWITGGGQNRLNSESHRLIEKAKALLESGVEVTLVVYDPLIGQVEGMGFPMENIKPLSLAYHANTESVMESNEGSEGI